MYSTSSLVKFFPHKLSKATTSLNIPFLFSKIPLDDKILSFPSDICPSDAAMSMPFNLGTNRKNLSSKNLAFFNRILFLPQFMPQVDNFTQCLVWLGLSSLPLAFANRLKDIKFDCVRLTGLPIIIKSFISNTPTYHSVRTWDVGCTQDIDYQKFLIKVSSLAFKRNKSSINLQFISFCKKNGFFYPNS